MMKYLITFALLAMTACGITQSRQATVPTATKSPEIAPSPSNSSHSSQDSPIRRIDFGNFVYDWYPTWADAPATGRRIILKDGSMDLNFAYGKEPRKFSLIDNGVSFGDLTGDESEEAVVILNTITSGTSRPYLIFVYRIADGKPERIWAFETGDRWDYGYHRAFIENEELVIERYKPNIVEYQGQKHDMSSSDRYVRGYYKWNGERFSEVKTQELPADPGDKNPWVVQVVKP
jgi:hypothetical protein